MLALFKKEISTFLHSLMGYIVISVFLAVNGLILWVFPNNFNILSFGYATLDGLFILAPFVFLFLLPAISMRSFAEEINTGTIELLMTKPISEFQIIFAKYLAGLVILVFSLLPTFFYFFTIYQLAVPTGNIDFGGIYGSYVGLLFLGSSFLAIGMFASSISKNQIVSFVIAIFLIAFMYLGFEFIFDIGIFGGAELFVKSMGINEHYVSMSRGVIDSRDLIYFISLIAVFLMFTRLSLEKRKW
ncbi:MAG: gliding motility-associated ABC transporter permease subunit GldF [Bacteroidetes bacterium HGW-Bacteroidetes-6]|jgi:ABC-2 type transport system permease protein|nr:MAG: gliding motility-associated ABC transporter permease subunit GldF [Bacteroidetes bacterium HGW-Bacteroidetes-6]